MDQDLAVIARLPDPPAASSPGVRAVMQSNRSKDTRHEVALRRELHRRGLRFRKHVALVPGLRFRPDIVFPRQRLAVECLGCFWHRCPTDGIIPRTNTKYWRAKLDRNVARDRRNAAAVAASGWHLIVVWEHEDPAKAADRIEAAVRGAARAK
jgi:DNA mismatch endonuclease, patch repair protein